MKLPRSYFNYISYLGTITALIAWFAIIFFIIQINFFALENVYFDLYAYIVTPAFLVIGLVLIPVGMYLKGRKIKKGLIISDDKLLIINLRDPKTRNGIFICNYSATKYGIFATDCTNLRRFKTTKGGLLAKID